MNKLPRRQQQLFDLLLGRGDVPIDHLYWSMQGNPVRNGDLLVADMQRWLGPYITALNRNLVDRKMRVEPGALKNTYRLVAVSE